MTRPALPGSLSASFQVGLYGFAEVLPDLETGTTASPAGRLADVLEEAVLADQVGLDVFGIGEHHRPEMFVANPAVVLAALAARTSRIRLTSAVSVLGSADPVRLFQDFAELDLLSNGRAEIIAGRGAFVESFPLHGRDLADYDALFTENLDLLLRLRSPTPVTWQGAFRPALVRRLVQPRPVQDRLPVWIGVGGTLGSAARAGTLGLPMALAVLGGGLSQGRAAVDAHRSAAAAAGHEAPAVAVSSHGFLADTSQAAAAGFLPHYAQYVGTYLSGPGRPRPTAQTLTALTGPGSALIVGSRAQAVEKMLTQHQVLGTTRYLMQTSLGSVPHRLVMRSIELLGEVAADVRAQLRPGELPRTG